MGQISILDYLQRTPMKSLNLNLLLWNAWYLNLHCTCSVAKPCPTFCDPMDCSTPSSPVLHYLPEFVHTHVHWVSDAIQSSRPLLPPSSPALNLPQHQDVYQWVTSGGQSTGASALASVLPMNFQGWFPLALTGLISLQSKLFSRVLSSITV